MRIGVFSTMSPEDLTQLVRMIHPDVKRGVTFSFVEEPSQVKDFDGIFLWICFEVPLGQTMAVLREIQRTSKVSVIYCDRENVEEELARLMSCFPQCQKVADGPVQLIKSCRKLLASTVA